MKTEYILMYLICIFNRVDENEEVESLLFAGESTILPFVSQSIL